MSQAAADPINAQAIDRSHRWPSPSIILFLEELEDIGDKAYWNAIVSQGC